MVIAQEEEKRQPGDVFREKTVKSQDFFIGNHSSFPATIAGIRLLNEGIFSDKANKGATGSSSRSTVSAPRQKCHGGIDLIFLNWPLFKTKQPVEITIADKACCVEFSRTLFGSRISSFFIH